MEERKTWEYTGVELQNALRKIADIPRDEQFYYFLDNEAYRGVSPLECIIRYLSIREILQRLRLYEDDKRKEEEERAGRAMREIVDKVGYDTAKELLVKTMMKKAEKEGKKDA